jgi:putative DNA primase/helicase
MNRSSPPPSDWFDSLAEVVPLHDTRATSGAPRRAEPVEEELPKGVAIDSDLANAYRFLRQHGETMRFVHRMEFWHEWDGARWRRDETCAAQRKAHQIGRHLEVHAAELLARAASLGDEDTRKRCQALAQRYLRWAAKSQSARQIEAALSVARALQEFAVVPEQLDRDPLLFACPNGTIDLRSGDLHAPRPTDLITKLSPVAYDAQAACPTWETFLRRIFVDDELIAYVQRACGYSMTGCTQEQCLFVLHGEGANGKSVLLETIRYVVGDYGQTTPTATLMDSQKSEHRNDVARLAGARFVTASESAEGKRFDEELVKRITGGDKMAARFLRREHFEFVPVLKLWMATNHKPEVRGVDHGIWRRLKLIPFSVTIPAAEQDPDLVAKLRAEAPGILAWCVRGCLDWQRGGLRAPGLIADATHEWRKEANQVAQFVDERCVTGDAEYVRAKSEDLYAAYRDWAKASGHEQLTMTAFGTRLASLGFKDVRTKHARFRTGIALRASADQRTGGDG